MFNTVTVVKQYAINPISANWFPFKTQMYALYLSGNQIPEFIKVFKVVIPDRVFMKNPVNLLRLLIQQAHPILNVHPPGIAGKSPQDVEAKPKRPRTCTGKPARGGQTILKNTMN